MVVVVVVVVAAGFFLIQGAEFLVKIVPDNLRYSDSSRGKSEKPKKKIANNV